MFFDFIYFFIIFMIVIGVGLLLLGSFYCYYGRLCELSENDSNRNIRSECQLQHF